MIITRVVEYVFLVLPVSVCFRGYADGGNPRSYPSSRPVRRPKRIVEPLRE